jgi:hypothetical protein
VTSPQSRLSPVVYYTYEEYNEAEKANTAALIALLILYLRPYVGIPISDVQWVEILKYIYPTVEYYRNESARLARAFYDSERAKYLDGSGVIDLDTRDPASPPPRHDVFLDNYRLEFFIEDLEPVRKRFQSETATNRDLTTVIGTAAKQVQNGGRRTATEAVRTDPLRVRFARVEGGGSSCAFCLMLISRGPVYHTASTAGSTEILDRFNATGDEGVLEGLMNRWHPNCDCRVVAVFDENDWPGRDRFKEAERLWISSTRGHSGPEAIKAFRHAVEG